MREIRFRAKRQDNGKWIQGSTLVTFSNGDSKAHYIPNSPCSVHAFTDENGNIMQMESMFCLVQSDTIGQFIGEQDVEGNDIYEGDIVQHGEKLYVIRYVDHYARFVGKNKGSIFAVFAFGNSIIRGNIYDDAFLMEATK